MRPARTTAFEFVEIPEIDDTLDRGLYSRYPDIRLRVFKRRTVALRSQADIPRTGIRDGRTWAIADVMVPTDPDWTREQLEDVCREAGVSVALSWLAAQWSGR